MVLKLVAAEAKYDNGSNMSGKYEGAQAHVTSIQSTGCFFTTWMSQSKLVWLTCSRMLSSGSNLFWYGTKVVQSFQQ